MLTHEMKMITIITESILEHGLLEDIERLGAKGYTIENVRGKGHRGVRHGDWSSDSNIRVEIVCDLKTADDIADHLKEAYYKDYAMMLFLSDVKVLRSEKF